MEKSNASSPSRESIGSNDGRTVPERENIEFLKNIYFFHAMPEDSLRKISALCSERDYEPGSILFFEDMPGDRFFIILDGELEIWKRYGQSDGVLLGVSGKGQPVGEMALIDEQPRSATVRARSLSRVLMLEAADFSRLMATDTAICVSLLKAVTMMVRRSNEAHVADLDRQNRELARAYADLAAAQEELVSRERLSVIGKFSSLILHDIRNPLSALKTRIELLAMHRDNRDYFDQAITKIQNDISRMETISAEFLDYARGEIRLKMTVSDISALLERFREILLMKTSGLGIELLIDNRATERVALDEERIIRVLVNAGENACKAMPLGGRLEVRAWIEDEKLFLELEDTGHGMSKEVLAHCFDPFYSMSTAGGTGLGMVIIKNIVDAHHGTVAVESEEGKGTRVRIALPAIM